VSSSDVSTPARDLLVLCAAAFVLRVAWALVYGRVNAGPHDALFYELSAAGIAHGKGFTNLLGAPTAHLPPGFPFLISLPYRVFGTNAKLGLGVNVVLGSATAGLMYLVARRMLGRSGGLVAGAFFALLPATIFFTGLFRVETTYAFMLVGFLALAAFLPQRRWTPVALGVAAGLAALTKGDGLLLVLIPPAMWWGELARREWWRRAAVLVAATVLTIAPWTIRNEVQMDAFVPLATSSSTMLWAGHNGQANGGSVDPPPTQLAEVAEAKQLRSRALHWAVRNPPKELGLIPRKLLQLGDATSPVFATEYNAPGDYQVGSSSRVVFDVLGDALDYFLIGAAIAALVLLGARSLWRFHPLMRGVLAYLAASLVVYGFVYYGDFRFRVAMEPLLILVATPLLLALWRGRGRLREEPA
jgi:4-amino-4-deoxy-L-arabinose transferase-like glycosyltransferase